MPGTVVIKPLEAKLERDINTFTKMDPYCVGILGNLQLKGQWCKNGGKRPYWNEAMILKKNEEQTCYIEVKEGDLIKDATIGVCEIPLDKLMERGTMTQWFELYFKQRQVGTILIEALYTENEYPSRMVFYTRPTRPKPVEEAPPQQVAKVNRTEVVQKHLPSANLAATTKQASVSSGFANVEGSNGLAPIVDKQVGPKADSPSKINKTEERPLSSGLQAPIGFTREQKEDTLRTQPPVKEKKKGIFSIFKKSKPEKTVQNPPSNIENREVNTMGGFEPLRRNKPPTANTEKPGILERQARPESPVKTTTIGSGEAGYEADRPLTRNRDSPPTTNVDYKTSSYGQDHYYGGVDRGLRDNVATRSFERRVITDNDGFDTQPRRNVVVSHGRTNPEQSLGGSRFNYR